MIVRYASEAKGQGPRQDVHLEKRYKVGFRKKALGAVIVESALSNFKRLS